MSTSEGSGLRSHSSSLCRPGKLPMSRETALRVAERLVELLGPGCERLSVAGSVRRGEPIVGDLEIVYVPRAEKVVTDLFGGGTKRSAVDPILDELISRGVLTVMQRGPINQRFQVQVVEPPCQLDLFSTLAASYGVVLAVRTGPRKFSQALVTPRSRGGLLDEGCRIAGGFRLWKRADLLTAADAAQLGADELTEEGQLHREIVTREEADFLAYAGGWVKPEDRR